MLEYLLCQIKNKGTYIDKHSCQKMLIKKKIVKFIM